MSALAGKTIFITGAARGIGAAMAKRFHRRGASVALVGLEKELLDQLASELKERCVAIEVDVTDRKALVHAADAVQQKFGPIDVAIMNAGVLHIGNFEGDDLSGFDRTLNVNLIGVVNGIHAVLPQVISQRGYILNVASVGAVINGPLVGAYATAKAGVDALSNSLRLELSRKGVAVGCAYFGAVDTDLVQGSRRHPAMDAMEAATPRILGAEIPVEKAVDAVERGVLKRASRIWAPGWIKMVYALRGILQPAVELRYRGDRALAAALDSVESAKNVFEQDSLLGAAGSIKNTDTEEVEDHDRA